MRLTSLIAVTLTAIATTGPAAAQEWVEFKSLDDRFTTNFPGPPTITQTTYTSQFGANLPARAYRATQGPSRYSVTVVDYSPIEKILGERAKSCLARRLYRRASVCDLAVHAARRTVDAAHLQQHVRGVRAATASDQPRWIAYGGRDLHARAEAVHRRGHGARRVSRAGAVPDVTCVARRKRPRDSLSLAVPPRVPASRPRTNGVG
jgi:hypothetical protein